MKIKYIVQVCFLGDKSHDLDINYANKQDRDKGFEVITKMMSEPKIVLSALNTAIRIGAIAYIKKKDIQGEEEG